MKKISVLDKLHKKLSLTFIIVIVISLLLVGGGLYYTTEQAFSDLADKQQLEMEERIQTQFDQAAEDLLSLTEIYASQNEIVNALQTNERSQIVQIMQPAFERLQTEHHLQVFEVGDTSGNVVMRGHNIEQYGDDKSHLPAIQSALSGKTIAGFEFGKSGLSVRAFAPLMKQNEVIGTLQTGIDGTFLKELQALYKDVVIDLYNSDGEVVISSNKEHVGKALKDRSILSAVKDNTVASKNERVYTSYMPMFDPTKTEVIGVIGIQQDISGMLETKRQMIVIGGVLAVGTLLFVFVIALNVSTTISRPITSTAEMMDKLASGDLALAIQTTNRRDEIGQLTNAMQMMKNKLHHIIQQVAQASANVAAHSEELFDSADTVNAGSRQIASTMQEIAADSEKQAFQLHDLASVIQQFSTKMKGSSEKGEIILRFSEEVHRMSLEGKQVMDSAETQMLKIDGIVQESVHKMNHLDKQTQNITKLVDVIHNVASQTNLLALNATIEAARAGEDGRGFAVVANEVKKLAEQVTRSVGDIESIVTNIQSESGQVKQTLETGYAEVTQGKAQIAATSTNLNTIQNAITEMKTHIREISGNLMDFSNHSEQITTSIEDISSISQNTAANVIHMADTSRQSSDTMEGIAEDIQSLASLSEDLNDVVHQFKLS